jgi:hypothetical protein
MTGKWSFALPLRGVLPDPKNYFNINQQKQHGNLTCRIWGFSRQKPSVKELKQVKEPLNKARFSNFSLG